MALKNGKPGKTVADYLIYECIDDEIIGDPTLKKIVSIYKIWYEENLEPTPKNFLYNEDLEMSNMVVSLIEFPYEVSPKWQEKI